MLPICVGEATKVAGALLAGRKGYTVQMRLGERTDTGDSEGQIVERLGVPEFEAAGVRLVLQALLGPQLQVPPMYSALKRDGQPLYKLARQGLSVEREARAIEIYELELLDMTATTLRLRVECSKGTYIRTLVEQIGAQLGSCAHVIALHRDFVEPFRGEAMYCLEQLAEGERPALLPADRAVPHLPALHLSSVQAWAITRGQLICIQGVEPGPVRLYDVAGRFLGLATGSEGGQVRPVRLFSTGTSAPA